MTPLARALAFALLLAAPAAAQDLAPVPEAWRGAWFSGGCEAPEAMLALSARGAARLPASGSPRLWRFTDAGEREGWWVGTARGTQAPRLLLRGAGEGIETAEPPDKLRDDRLPGEQPSTAWGRCAVPPPALAALHGEGIAFLGALERLEAACVGGVPDCARALVSVGDVSGDGRLGVAEVARLLRGAAWLLGVQSESAPEALGLVGGAGALGGLALARLLVDSLDYDGDGRLSAEELAQDRAALAAPGDPAGRPLALERVTDTLFLLRALYEGLTAGE